jgi:hypothetical protein
MIRILSFGAGVQSSTLLEMALRGDIEPIDHVIFADTGWEPASVYENLEMYRPRCEAAGIGFHVVSGGNIRADALDGSVRAASMPVHVIGREENGAAIARRQCTSAYKLDPLLKKQRELAGLKKGGRSKEHLVTSIIGISLDEIQRMRDAMFPWIRNEYPLVDMRMSRQSCVAYWERLGMPSPPRSACIGCPYHSNHEWRRLTAEEFADACEFDEAIRVPGPVADRLFNGRAYLHSDRIPLAAVDLSTEEDRGQGVLFDSECLGMCGL